VLDGVRIDGITPDQVHGRFAMVTLGPRGTNLDFSKTEISVIPFKGSDAKRQSMNCAEKFVPMR
jgi:hypothetical protein